MNYKHKCKKKKQVTYVILTTTIYNYEVTKFLAECFYIPLIYSSHHHQGKYYHPQFKVRKINIQRN